MLGGRNQEGEYLSDVVLYDTRRSISRTIVAEGQLKFVTVNQSARLVPNELIALVSDPNNKPFLIGYKRGEESFRILESWERKNTKSGRFDGSKRHSEDVQKLLLPRIV